MQIALNTDTALSRRLALHEFDDFEGIAPPSALAFRIGRRPAFTVCLCQRLCMAPKYLGLAVLNTATIRQ